MTTYTSNLGMFEVAAVTGRQPPSERTYTMKKGLATIALTTLCLVLLNAVDPTTDRDRSPVALGAVQPPASTEPPAPVFSSRAVIGKNTRRRIPTAVLDDRAQSWQTCLATLNSDAESMDFAKLRRVVEDAASRLTHLSPGGISVAILQVKKLRPQRLLIAELMKIRLRAGRQADLHWLDHVQDRHIRKSAYESIARLWSGHSLNEAWT